METNKITAFFKQELHVVNMGLETFADNLKEQDTTVIQMDWRPPAGGNERLIALLKKIGR